MEEVGWVIPVSTLLSAVTDYLWTGQIEAVLPEYVEASMNGEVCRFVVGTGYSMCGYNMTAL